MENQLAHVLNSHIGYKIKISSPRVDISSAYKDYQCQGNLYLMFWKTDEAPESFVVEDKYCELEDYPFISQEAEPTETDWFQFRDGDMAYGIVCKITKDYIADLQPVRLSNDFHEIVKVLVYKRKRHNTRLRGGENEALFSSPELYILEFKSGNEIIIYYNEAGPYKSIFYSENEFLISLYEWKRLSMNDFDIVA